ncbi:MAG: methyltransferase [Euryarchaeota archaeon]|nr:methyltransferase [Euryarchaeota archaeon]
MKIAAGVGKNKNILEASKLVEFDVILTESEEEFIDMLFEGKVDAAIRGSLSASKIIPKLKQKYPKGVSRASFLEIDGYKFLLAPVGIDEGDDISGKIQIIENGAEFLLKMGIKPKIAVISGGRAQDKGRSDKIDNSIVQGEVLTAITKNKYSIKHYFILIEKAIADKANFILAPDGICGNLIFRTFIFWGSGKSHGAVTLGIEEIFIDTSRSQTVKGYVSALEFARYLVELKTKNKKVD